MSLGIRQRKKSNKMKKNFLKIIRIIMMLFFVSLLSFSCKKENNTTNVDVNLPVLTTIVATDLTQTTATCGGIITKSPGSDVKSRGVCWSTSSNPTISNSKTVNGIGIGSFTSNITGLIKGTTYYVRAYATNNSGTGYGNLISFTTQGGTAGTVTDIDGNVYHTVIIGTQVWMLENLKTTKYRNGDPIQNVTDQSIWNNLTTGAYCNYNNNTSNVAVYGRLYNWFAVNDSRKIAPAGWHIPSDAEWLTLINFAGGEYHAGGNLKETGTIHWNTTNSFVTNSTGFTALPGGARGKYISFSEIGNYCYLWSSDENGDVGNCFYLDASSVFVDKWSTFKSDGISIRCIKD